MYKASVMAATLLLLSANASASGWLFSASAGYADFIHQPSPTFRISNYVTDSLNGADQHHYPAVGVSLKKQIALPDGYGLAYAAIGPAAYYEKVSYTGDVWELQQPEFDNYSYDLSSENLDLFVEGDLYFRPLFQRISPFITAGIGAGIDDLQYHDSAKPGIPVDSELNVSKRNAKLAWEAGAGISAAINSHWSVNLRYSYIDSGHANTSTDTDINMQEPVRVRLASHNVFLGLSYSGDLT